MSPELLKIVSSRAIVNEKSDILLVDMDETPDFNKPIIHMVENMDKFIPAWLNLPHVEAIIGEPVLPQVLE
jgi:myosin-5